MSIASLDGIKKSMALIIACRQETAHIFSDRLSVRIITQVKNTLKSKTLINPKSEAPRNGLRLGLPLESLQRCFHIGGAVSAVSLQF